MKQVLLVGKLTYYHYTKTAREAGYRVIFLTEKSSYNPEWDTWFDEVIFVSNLFDWNEVKTALDQYKLDGVYNRAEDFTLLTAAIAEHYGLPGVGFKQAHSFRNKWLMKQDLQKDAVPSAEGVVVSEVQDAEEFLKSHQFPLILKQISGIHSSLVKKVKSKEELAETLVDFKKTLTVKSNDLHKSLQGYPVQVDVPDSKTHFLLETMLSGIEITVDTFVSNGQFFHTPICVYTMAEELGSSEHYLPIRTMPWADLTPEAQQATLQTTEQALTALKANACACHSELFLDQNTNQCYVVEIAARGGGFRSEMLSAATGADYDLANIQVACGQDPNLVFTKDKAISVVEVFSDKEGTLAGIDLSPIENNPAIIEMRQYSKVGEMVGPSSKAYRQVVKFSVLGDTFQEAITKAKQYFTTIQNSIKLT